MARTLTGNSRRREQQLQSLMQDRLSAFHQRRIAREIARAMNRAATLMESGEPMAVDIATQEHAQRMGRVMTGVWTQTIGQFADHMTGEDRSTVKRIPTDLDTPRVPATLVADRAVNDYVRSFGAQKITQITSTTAEDIRTAIQDGIEQGLSERQIARHIKQLAPGKSASRAQTIARTETHGAASAAAQTTAYLYEQELGLQMRKVWVAAGDERTRGDHADADGQSVGLHEYFVVGGVELMYPGDPSSDAPEQVINCRCGVVYEFE